MNENLADIRLMKQLKEVAKEGKPSLPFYSGDQCTDRLAKNWPKHVMEFPYVKSTETDPPKHIPRKHSMAIDQVKKSTTETLTELPVKLAKQRGQAGITRLCGDRILGKDVVSSYEAKEIYKEKKEVNGEDS